MFVKYLSVASGRLPPNLGRLSVLAGRGSWTPVLTALSCLRRRFQPQCESEFTNLFSNISYIRISNNYIDIKIEIVFLEEIFVLKWGFFMSYSQLYRLSRWTYFYQICISGQNMGGIILNKCLKINLYFGQNISFQIDLKKGSSDVLKWILK